VRGRRLNLQQDSFEYSGGFGQNLSVREPEDLSTHRFERLCPLFISGRLNFLEMMPTIDFDDEPVLKTVEVDDVTPDELLASKLSAPQPAISQVVPET
jgi:hypothetical protein